MGRLGRTMLAIALVVILAVVLVLLVLAYQGKRKPVVGSDYVALGSSFAAGLGLGPREPGSPYICQRSVNGYPQQLARTLHLSLTDMTCSGATVAHVLRGGQVFLGPQIDAIGPTTRLVTITAGGNDVGYVGDLTAMVYRRREGVIGFLVGRLWSGPKALERRGFAALDKDLRATLRDIRRRAPHARIVVVTYPRILPPDGTCSGIGIDAAEAELMRPVAFRLAEVTRQAARAAGAILVDAAVLSEGHDACAAGHWVNGALPKTGAPFHPMLAGARAIADGIARALNQEGFVPDGSR